MLSKKTVIGAFILLALIGGTFWHLHVQRIMNTEPTKVYKAPETPAATPTTGGHWHGDEWHAEPHPAPAAAEPLVEVAPRVVPRLPTLEEVQEELRAIVARPLPPNADELAQEKRALTEETIMLNEKAHTLSEAEFIKRSKDLLERQLDWNKRSSKRWRERLAAIRQAAEAKRARARSNRGDN